MTGTEIPSLHQLVEAFLRSRDDNSTGTEIEARDHSACEYKLSDVFDLLVERLSDSNYEPSALGEALQMGNGDGCEKSGTGYSGSILHAVVDLATEAGLADPTEFALSWRILLMGSIISTVAGDLNAARRAKLMAKTLLLEHRPSTPPLMYSARDEDAAFDYLGWEIEHPDSTLPFQRATIVAAELGFLDDY